MKETIFEKIIKREIPSLIVYEDNTYIAILDIDPKQKGHTLLIPKNKKQNIFNEPKEVKQSILSVATNIATTLKNKLGASGIKIVVNSGQTSGQVVMHTHVHLIPYYDQEPPKENNKSVLDEILK